MRCADNNGAVYALHHRKYCAHEGCDRFAAFGLPGDRRKVYCQLHKTNNMIKLIIY